MRRFLLLILITGTFVQMKAQNENDYYYEIPEYPEKFTAGTVAGRTVDGLGFRFYWATAGLRPEDLVSKASEEGRTLEETVDHIYNLTMIVMNATKKEPTVFPVEISGLSFDEKRNAILEFIKTAANNLKAAKDKEFKEFKMIFQYADGNSNEWPFWNELNGPMADALWHTGQLVVLRRVSGNPFSSNVSVLSGKVRN
ncbi:MAG: hypothetical protein HEP71_21805 [Roseivirga sp.]|nr:hypothetical protein [Roseivirga sp.]